MHRACHLLRPLMNIFKLFTCMHNIEPRNSGLEVGQESVTKTGLQQEYTHFLSFIPAPDEGSSIRMAHERFTETVDAVVGVISEWDTRHVRHVQITNTLHFRVAIGPYCHAKHILQAQGGHPSCRRFHEFLRKCLQDNEADETRRETRHSLTHRQQREASYWPASGLEPWEEIIFRLCHQ